VHRVGVSKGVAGGTTRQKNPWTIRDSYFGQVCDYLAGFTLGEKARQKENEGPALINLGADYSQEEEERLAANAGVATDGSTFVFVQRRGKAWHTEDRALDEDTVEKLILWLRAMIRKDLSPENLIGDFGPERPIAASVVGVLAKLVASGDHPKANVIFEEWA
jgi:hypothetical protein